MSILYTLLYTDAPDTNLLPPAGMYYISNPNNVGSSSSRVVFAPNPPNWTATKSSTDEIGGITLTTNTVIQQGFFVTSFGTSFSSPVSYSSSGGNIMADGALLLSGTGGVREISPMSDIAYAWYRLSVGANSINIRSYALVTSNGQLYRFSRMKIARDPSGGTLFINDATRTAVYSMSAAVTQFIRTAAPTVPPTIPPTVPPFIPLSYNLEVVGSNVQINFGSAGAYRITGSMLVTDNSAGTIVFTGNSIGSAAGITAGINRFFHVQEATATSTNVRVLVPANEYTDLFVNTGARQGLVVNNPFVLSIIRAVMSFTGTIGQFTVTSTGVTFNGVPVMQLMRGSTQNVTLTARDQLSYINGTLTVISGGENQVFSRSGVQRVTVQQGTGAAINNGSAAAAISGPGTLFVEGNMAFFTNDTNVIMTIGNQLGTTTPVTQPTTQPTMPPMPPNITITTASGISTLNFDGNAVVTLDSSRRRQITSGQRIQYQNKNLVVFPVEGNNPVLTLMNIGQFVVYNDGDQTSTTFTGSMPEIMILTGTLYYDGTRAFFTNRNAVKNIIDNALNTPTSPGTTSSPITTPSSGTTPSSSTTPFTEVPSTVATEEPSTSDWSTCILGPWNTVSL